MKRKALIIGVNSQDGSYLADLLHSKNYKIFGTVRNLKNLKKKWQKETNVSLVKLNTFNFVSIDKIIKRTNPDEIYNFTGLTAGSEMYDNVIEACNVNGNFVMYIMESLKNAKKQIRFCNSSSREIFGIKKKSLIINEKTKIDPRSPYGAAKAFATNIIKIYRERYGLFCGSAIFFNHESPRRGYNFVTRKISSSAVKIKLKKQKKLKLGTLDSSRDWGFAGDYVNAMWLMLQSDKPDDYVISTGKTNTIREFCKEAFKLLDLNYLDFVEIDTNINLREKKNYKLAGDFSKAKNELDWKPKVKFRQLVKMMVESDYELEK